MGMELLSPAGNADALCAAVQSGADAVYLAGQSFGARQSAENFTVPEIKKWTDYCHLYGIKVHVAVNTLIKEKEIPQLIEYVKQLNFAGVDALIIQDIGAAEIIGNILPDMELHGSTQMTVTSLEGVKYLESMGFSRVVLARELSVKEIEHICRNSKAEIEVFVHGAICMCYSGQCLMSSILGGRSGNRGRCAQPCRLPYEMLERGKSVGKGYLLSMKDMTLIDDLGTLNKIGVSSLKIEGRLKRAEYVSAVVGIYRKYLDKVTSGGAEYASKSDMRELLDAFSRTGFTDGYFKGNLGKNMMSHDLPGNSAKSKFTDAAKARASQNANVRKIPVGIIGTLKADSPFEVTMYDDDGNYAYVSGTLTPECALHKITDEQLIIKQLEKLGQTPFECKEAAAYADEGITIPIKEINGVRREAALRLAALRQKRDVGRISEYKIITDTIDKPSEMTLSAEVETEEQLRAAVKHHIGTIYVPVKILGTLNNEIKKEIKKEIENKNIEIVTKASEIFAEEKVETEAVLVSSLSAVYKYRTKKLIGDYRLNVFNSQTARRFGFMSRITLSPELNINEIRSICENTAVLTEVAAYGRLPLMLMKNCPVRAMGKCQKGKCIYTLKDRKSEEFPIMCGSGCTAKLLNSKPIFMADKLYDLKKAKINSIRLIFTVEKFSQCDKIISVYKNALNGEKTENFMAENSYTRGHFYRGVL